MATRIELHRQHNEACVKRCNKEERKQRSENDLKEKFPNVYINFMEFSKECEAYITFVEECGILKDIGRYVVVDKLDK